MEKPSWQLETSVKRNMASRAVEILREKGIRSFSGKASSYIAAKLEFFALPYALLAIKRLKTDCASDELVNFAFNDCAGLIRPAQVQSEIAGLLERINEIKPKVILEIGTANGGTLFLFSRIAPEDATIVSVDLPGGGFGGGYSAWRTLLYKAFPLRGKKMHLFRADSHKNETLEQVKVVLDGQQIDFLFIDGDHTYEGVKRDFEMYSPLVRKGGMVAFHDIVPHLAEAGCEVTQLWEEMKYGYDHMELVENQSQNWAGIGIIYM